MAVPVDPVAREHAAVRYLEVHFEGYFMGRITTDPDPTNEPRGKSGYTMALAGEENLDQTIRLQFDAERQNLRQPAHRMDGKEFEGVRVTAVTFEQSPLECSPLVGARVNLLGDEGRAGPVFESRNNIVGSDDTFGFVVDPFELRIENGDARLAARAVINPNDPEEQIWQVADPSVYVSRLPVEVTQADDEINTATGVFDYYEYFRARREWLRIQIEGREHEANLVRLVGDPRGAAAPADSVRQASSGALGRMGYRPHNHDLVAHVREMLSDRAEARLAKLEGLLPTSLDADLETMELERQSYISRLFQLESWGDRVISKMGSKVTWDHFVHGDEGSTFRGFRADERKWRLDLERPWRVRYWYGGWDGDLLLGYHRGTLFIPSLPA